MNTQNQKKSSFLNSLYYVPLTNTGTVVKGIITLLTLLVLTGIVILLFFNKPNPRKILERNINNFEYFLGESEVIEYEHNGMFRGPLDIFIKTTFNPEKIPEILKANPIKICKGDDAVCAEQIWIGSYEAGEWCTEVIVSRKTEYVHFKQTRHKVCVNSVTKTFRYYSNS